MARICDERAFELERKVTESVALMRKIRDDALTYFKWGETCSKQVTTRGRRNFVSSGIRKYDLIPKITKTQYNANLKRIDELTVKLSELSQKSTEHLLEAEAEEALAESQTKHECTQAKRQRT